MNKSVLIIEDDDVQCQALCRLLDLRGIRATCAESWKDGIECAREQTFDLAVVDLGLPDSEADHTADNLYKLKMPVVAMTGLDDPELIRKFQRQQLPFVLKPVVTRDFIKTVLTELEFHAPSEHLEQAILETRHMEATPVVQDKNWLRRNAAAIAVCLAFVSSAGTVAFAFYDSGIADATKVASEKVVIGHQLDQLRATDKTMADALSQLAAEVRQLQNFDIDSKNDRANLHSEVGRVTSEIGALRAEFGAAQRRFERNQIRMMLKMGLQPVNGERDE